jgi:AcrR family transcriptional regulator
MLKAKKGQYAGESGQERIARRRQELIQAAQGLIVEDGWRQLNIDRICQTAGLHKRYFYESFSDMDEIASAVVDHLGDEVFQAISVFQGSNAPIAELTRMVMSALVNHFADVPMRAHILFGELHSNEAVAAHRAQAIHRIEAMVVARAGFVHGKTAATEPLAVVTASLLVGGTGQVILSWLNGNIAVSRDGLIEHLSQLWLITGEGAAAFVKKSHADSAKKGPASSRLR